MDPLRHLLPADLVSRVRWLALEPSPSCVAFKKAVHTGIAVPIPGLHMLTVVKSAVGKQRAMQLDSTDINSFPLCRRCADIDVWISRRDILVTPFWYWFSDDSCFSWQISSHKACDVCNGIFARLSP